MKNRLRVGMVGAGSVVREIYQHLFFRSRYSSILEVVAVAEPNAVARKWFAELAGLPEARCFENHRDMLLDVELDALQVNTPDHFHRDPAVDGLEAGLDVMLPKPLASSVGDAQAIRDAARRNDRLVGVDFHKRDDPRIKEAAARYQAGRYGRWQVAFWTMLDKLFVSDPNHRPMFFASDDFAEKNSPISFLTVHMADSFMEIVREWPVEVRATAYAHKLPSLAPRPVRGMDLADVEVRFESGGIAHILTGWHLPNTAHATTVQSGSLVCSDGLVELAQDRSGYMEIHADGLAEVNSLFLGADPDGRISGFGVDCPGRLYEAFLAGRRGELDAGERNYLLTPRAMGFDTTLVLHGAEQSLAEGETIAEGVHRGVPIDLNALLRNELGESAARELRDAAGSSVREAVS